MTGHQPCIGVICQQRKAAFVTAVSRAALSHNLRQCQLVIMAACTDCRLRADRLLAHPEAAEVGVNQHAPRFSRLLRCAGDQVALLDGGVVAPQGLLALRYPQLADRQVLPPARLRLQRLSCARDIAHVIAS